MAEPTPHPWRRTDPGGGSFKPFSEQILPKLRAELARRNALVEDAILRLAEHGQRVDRIEYHQDGMGLETHAILVVGDLDAKTLRLRDCTCRPPFGGGCYALDRLCRMHGNGG